MDAEIGGLTMKTLIELIQEDPNNSDAYLVYADSLQSSGDPRGELIALHYRVSRQPDDKQAARDAREHFDKHAEIFAGPLGAYPAKNLALCWYLGFIKGAELSFDTFDKLRNALIVLLASPSVRFLQRLGLRATGRIRAVDRRAGYAELAQLLSEKRHPVTLRELQLGKPGEYPISPELRRAFPGLDAHRDPLELWRDVKDGIAGQKRLKIKLDATLLADLELRDPALELEPAVDKHSLLVGLKAELGKSRHLGVVTAMKRLFTAESCDAFAEGLAAQWEAQGSKSAQAWALDAGGALGGERMTVFLAERLLSFSHQRAVRGMELLSEIGSPAAIDEIYGVCSLIDAYHPRREASRNILRQLAVSRRLSVQQMIDRIDLTGLPDRLERRARSRYPRRLEDLMYNGHRLSRVDFEAFVLDDAIRAPAAARVVWGIFDREHDSVAGTFRIQRIDEGDQPVYLNGASAALSGELRIGVVHPAEIGNEERTAWQEVFAQHQIAQDFEQLSRPVYRPRATEYASGSLDRFRNRRVDFDFFQISLERRGWYVSERIDAGIVESWSKYFERDDVAMSAYHHGVWCDDPSFNRSLLDLHPVTLSEILYDMESATRRSRAEPDSPGTQARILPQRGDYPFTEAAKSGRSTCVICSEKIPRGARRIGIERIIETPYFTGPKTAWLHYECRQSCPELHAIANLDDVLESKAR